MYVCARFHEIPAKGLQDIKESKCYGRDGRTDARTDGRTDNVKTVYPPYNFLIAGGITNKVNTLERNINSYRLNSN